MCDKLVDEKLIRVLKDGYKSYNLDALNTSKYNIYRRTFYYGKLSIIFRYYV